MTTNPIQPYLDDIIAGRSSLVLEIKNEGGHVVGEMRPLTREYVNQSEILQNLTDWRNQNMDRFLTQFQSTPERTKNWLENVVFKAHGQVLFLVYEANNLVGHLGFKELTIDEGMLDNAIKGERTNDPKLFVYAHKTLAQWLFSIGKVQRLYGYVLTDNVMGIMMNRQIGWEIWDRHPLLKCEKDGDITWKIGAKEQPSPDNKYCFKVILFREALNNSKLRHCGLDPQSLPQ